MGSSKVEVFETYFYDVLTTQYDHPRYVCFRHVLGRNYLFFTLFWYLLRGGGGGGAPKGLVHNLLTQFFSLDRSKIKVSKIDFFIIVTTHMTIQGM